MQYKYKVKTWGAPGRSLKHIWGHDWEEAVMKTQLAITSALALATLSAMPGAAQSANDEPRPQGQRLSPALQVATLQAAALQTTQAQTTQVQTNSALRDAALQDAQLREALIQREQLQLPARPDRPRRVSINWGQAREDFQRQSRITGGEVMTTAVNLVQRFPRPDNEEAAGVVNTRLPVLMPTLEALDLGAAPRTRLFPRENFYTLSIRGPNILIEVFGTRLAHAEAPDAASQRRLLARASNLDISQTEYGVEVNFNRYGAAYSITIECTNPRTDLRCRQTDYAQRIAETLVIAGGTPGEGDEL